MMGEQLHALFLSIPKAAVVTQWPINNSKFLLHNFGFAYEGKREKNTKTASAKKLWQLTWIFVYLELFGGKAQFCNHSINLIGTRP